MHHWDTCKSDSMSSVLFFFQQQYMLKQLKHTHLTLIPNKQGSTSLSDFCLISCVGVVYKLVSKLLASRLLATLLNIISPNQIGFLKGRRISDVVGLCQESTYGFNNQGGSQRACISMNLSNDFDTLKWDTTSVALEEMGYNLIFRKLIKACISSMSSSILVEGSPT